MRFIGNKEKLLNVIDQFINDNNIRGKSFFDLFAGTTNVGKFFKRKNYSIISSDLLYFSYVLQRAYIKNNKFPSFKKLLNKIQTHNFKLFHSPLEIIIDYLNTIDGIEGFIFKNYTPGGTKDLRLPRTYFIDDNGKRIDAIRIQIENWKNDKTINLNEYYILLTCLIESVPYYANISGVYAAFNKIWDPRAIKPFKLRHIELILSNKNHKVYNIDSLKLVDKIECDILYIDPPYNQRQYGPNYHLLETIALYDNPHIYGVTGLRNTDNIKSTFCNRNTALNSLESILEKGKYKHLVLSYNSEGIMSEEDITNILSRFGKVKKFDFTYSRFKSNNNGLAKTTKFIKENLYAISV